MCNFIADNLLEHLRCQIITREGGSPRSQSSAHLILAQKFGAATTEKENHTGINYDFADLQELRLYVSNITPKNDDVISVRHLIESVDFIVDVLMQKSDLYNIENGDIHLKDGLFADPDILKLINDVFSDNRYQKQIVTGGSLTRVSSAPTTASVPITIPEHQRMRRRSSTPFTPVNSPV